MRGILAAVGGAALLAGLSVVPAAAQEGVDALELSDPGVLHCSHPNSRRKTCRAIEVYEPIQEGVYGNTTLQAVGNGITLEFFTPVWLVDGAHCGAFREQDLMSGILRVGDREVAPQLAAAALEQARRKAAPMLGQEYCVRYERTGSDYVARVTLAGERRPDLDVPFTLISADDGYRVVL